MKKELISRATRILTDAEEIKEKYLEYLQHIPDEIINKMQIDTETKEEIQHKFILEQIKSYGLNYRSDTVYYAFKSVLSS